MERVQKSKDNLRFSKKSEKMDNAPYLLLAGSLTMSLQ
jgi:hypothetical protein